MLQEQSDQGLHHSRSSLIRVYTTPTPGAVWSGSTPLQEQSDQALHQFRSSLIRVYTTPVAVWSGSTPLQEQSDQGLHHSRSSLIRVYTVCHSVCIFWMHYSMIKPQCSNFRVITANFSGVRIFRIFRVIVFVLYEKYEPRHDKTNKMTVHPAKSQISLGICPVWSESSLCAQWVATDPSFLHADSEDSDQTGGWYVMLNLKRNERSILPQLGVVLCSCVSILDDMWVKSQKKDFARSVTPNK